MAKKYKKKKQWFRNAYQNVRTRYVTYQAKRRTRRSSRPKRKGLFGLKKKYNWIVYLLGLGLLIFGVKKFLPAQWEMLCGLFRKKE